jgi:hypothetical protein
MHDMVNALYAGIRLWGRRTRRLVRFFGRLRIPIVVGMFLAAAFAVPQQSHEVYRGFADAPLEKLLPIFFSFVSLVVLSTSTTLVCVGILQTMSASRLRLPHLLGIGAISSASFWALGAGLFAAKLADGKWGEVVNGRLELFGVLSLFAGLIAALYPFWIHFVHPGLSKKVANVFGRPSFAFVWVGWVLLSTILVLFLGPIVAGSLGPIAVLTWFALSLLVAAAHLGFMSDRYGYPLLGFVIVLSVAFSVLELNHNHEIRQVGSHPRNSIPTMSDAFKEWLANRADLPAYRARQLSYPVFVISAEGGGIYAAYNSALTLARLQDSCPRFAQHTFAISAVSGGSVGSSLFAALAARSAPNQDNLPCGPETVISGIFQDAARRFFTQDLLSPLLAGAAFPDFVQSVLPVRIPSLDRARSLEHALEQAWKLAAPGELNVFADSFKSLWRASASVPALILNTTEANRGRSELIAPFRVNLLLAPQTLASLGSVTDIRLSTAAVASSRFPWVTPAATLTTPHGIIQLVDGGYFENSGAETAHNVISALTEDTAQRAGSISTSVLLDGQNVFVEFRLISIRARIMPSFPSIGGELLAPINALMNARHERGVLSFRNAFFDLCRKCSLQTLRIDDSVLVSLLDMRDFAYPLGWYLTQRSQDRISTELGDSQRCPLQNEAGIGRDQTRLNNDCLYLAVFNYLNASPHKQLTSPQVGQ